MTKHYIVLGVPQTATKEQIKRAYRRLSLIYHPDMPTADKKKYLEVKEAYDALIKIDPTKVHQQYEHRTKPYVHIISKRLSKEGNAQIFIMFENMAVAHTSHFGMSSTWHLMGMNSGTIELDKAFLRNCGYKFNILFSSINGNTLILKQFEFDEPFAWFWKIVYSFKRYFL